MDLNFSKKVDYNRLKIDYVVLIWPDNGFIDKILVNENPF